MYTNGQTQPAVVRASTGSAVHVQANCTQTLGVVYLLFHLTIRSRDRKRAEANSRRHASLHTTPRNTSKRAPKRLSPEEKAWALYMQEVRRNAKGDHI